MCKSVGRLFVLCSPIRRSSRAAGCVLQASAPQPGGRHRSRRETLGIGNRSICRRAKDPSASLPGLSTWLAGVSPHFAHCHEQREQFISAEPVWPIYCGCKSLPSHLRGRRPREGRWLGIPDLSRSPPWFGYPSSGRRSYASQPLVKSQRRGKSVARLRGRSCHRHLWRCSPSSPAVRRPHSSAHSPHGCRNPQHS